MQFIIYVLKSPLQIFYKNIRHTANASDLWDVIPCGLVEEY